MASIVNLRYGTQSVPFELPIKPETVAAEFGLEVRSVRFSRTENGPRVSELAAGQDYVVLGTALAAQAPVATTITKDDIAEVMRTELKREREESESTTSLALSGLQSAGNFAKLRRRAGLVLEERVLTGNNVEEASKICDSLFQWNDMLEEKKQYAECKKELLKRLVIPREFTLEIIDNQTELTMLAEPLKLKGGMDMGVFHRLAFRGSYRVGGLVLNLELKKQLPNRGYFQQSIGEHVAAELLSSFSVVTVLTDLRTHWEFIWTEKRQRAETICHIAIANRDLACAHISAVLHQISNSTSQSPVKLPFEVMPIDPAKRHKYSAAHPAVATTEQEEDDVEEDDVEENVERDDWLRRRASRALSAARGFLPPEALWPLERMVAPDYLSYIA